MGRFAEDVVKWAWQTKHGDGVRVSVGEVADTGGKSPSLDWPVGRGLCLPTSPAGALGSVQTTFSPLRSLLAL